MSAVVEVGIAPQIRTPPGGSGKVSECGQQIKKRDSMGRRMSGNKSLRQGEIVAGPRHLHRVNLFGGWDGRDV